MPRPHPALVEIAAQRPMPSVQDAEILVASAFEHRMEGLLWSEGRLEEHGLPNDLVKRVALEELRSRASQNRVWAALREVAARLDDHEVAFLTFKGVTAEARWYDRVGQRPTTDIDILIAPTDRARVREIVHLLDPGFASAAEVEPVVIDGTMQAVTVDLGEGLTADIHFELPALGVTVAERSKIWERSHYLEMEGGGEIRVLDRETALVHLLLHLNKDCFARLMWYADVAHLISREPDLDWTYIQDFAKSEGLEAPIYLSLRAVCEDLGLPVLPHPAVKGWKAWVWRWLWPAKVRLQGTEGYLRRRHRRYVLAFMFKGRKRQAFRWWLRQLFPPDIVLRLWYPAARGPYLWRLVGARLGRGWDSYWTARRLRSR